MIIDTSFISEYKEKHSDHWQWNRFEKISVDQYWFNFDCYSTSNILPSPLIHFVSSFLISLFLFFFFYYFFSL